MSSIKTQSSQENIINSADVAIIGGGASGFFTALRIKELCPDCSVVIFEAGSQVLKKVRISGGGRCNVTHNLFETKKFVQNYPRGSKELRSPLLQFQAQDTVEWFKDRGVELVAEPDGRMFPTTNTSETIINCFVDSAKKNQISILKNHNVQKITKLPNESFQLSIKNQPDFTTSHLVIATGSSPTGYRFAKALGHKVTDLAPSLFSFKIVDPLLKDKAGTSFKDCKLSLKIETLEGLKKGFTQSGPLLITHWGLSGPAILKLSAWAAREFKSAQYKAKLHVNWLGADNLDSVLNCLIELKATKGKTALKNAYPKTISRSFWERLLSVLEVNGEVKYSETSNKILRKISDALFSYKLEIDGKNRYKDEFVECGGISLKEINFKTMESKVSPNLYFTGEILDVDGITGGFNFQNAWTTGWLAGSAIAKTT